MDHSHLECTHLPSGQQRDASDHPKYNEHWLSMFEAIDNYMWAPLSTVHKQHDYRSHECSGGSKGVSNTDNTWLIVKNMRLHASCLQSFWGPYAGFSRPMQAIWQNKVICFIRAAFLMDLEDDISSPTRLACVVVSDASDNYYLPCTHVARSWKSSVSGTVMHGYLWSHII